MPALRLRTAAAAVCLLTSVLVAVSTSVAAAADRPDVPAVGPGWVAARLGPAPPPDGAGLRQLLAALRTPRRPAVADDSWMLRTLRQPVDRPPPPPVLPCDVVCRGWQAVAAVNVDVPPGWQVQVTGPKPGQLGTTRWPAGQVALHARDGWTVDELAYVLAHELGHAWDISTLDDRERAGWAAARGFVFAGRAGWFGRCIGCDDASTGTGDFAETVAACRHPGVRPFRSRLAGPPGPAVCADVDRLLADGGGR